MATEINQQFPLLLKLDSTATFEGFWSSADKQSVAAIEQLAINQDGAWIYLTGARGSGVSHLLQACSAHANDHDITSMYLSLVELIAVADASSESDRVAMEGYLDSLEDFDLLCIDDIDQLQGQPFWQEQVFYLLEKLKNKPHSRLLLGGACLASQLDVLADLKSRLMWATGFQLSVLSDPQKAQVLQFKAERLGLAMSTEVAIFLLNRCSRNMADLIKVLSQLDLLAMSSGRRLTIPWIKSVMNL